MHIGGAPGLQPEQLQQSAAHARITLDLTRSAPAVIAHASEPTGLLGAQMPTYNPVTDLIARQSQMADALMQSVPPPKRTPAGAYGGTPPAPSIIDLRA